MTEQISHKKSLPKVNKERRAQLKEYYRLEEEAEEAEEHKRTEPKPNATSSHVQEDKPIEQLKFQELVHTHNRLLSKETETNNSIKNTIYENYYDLIKVNDLLKSMTGSNEKELNQLKKAVELLEE
ncbi:hypothetical protein ZYGR_0AD06710 [Zygosaccharomyces rouxii]|uniref:ZYRO0G21516p n=2 Tax=Zygosaccharomyces rouxii TaxID=4956 RepID=C5E1J6_ZYGRC|nr:uncharacterized protein ZYRO0G21516g [Zygosaccharomyces rouxii]KAH9202970.1 hypothetical protein LQ764DRAFT_73408 [Zygosaccharomyces rouxii]GAV51488.1 hypothetical protein ZYGR_0AD06710 [Zygosaccharomyces rouxii]CAR29980.1 ZYRO0G21516p [Zygosaccharomyces rouxii]